MYRELFYYDKRPNLYWVPSDGLTKRGPVARKLGGHIFSVPKQSDL